MSQILEVETETDKYVLKGRTCELSAFSFIQPFRKIPPERTFFNNTNIRKNDPKSTYDTLFHHESGYNNKLLRDDRRHARLMGIDINREETAKIVPAQSSSEYGHRIPRSGSIDPLDRSRVRTSCIKEEFYRSNGINFMKTII